MTESKPVDATTPGLTESVSAINLGDSKESETAQQSAAPAKVDDAPDDDAPDDDADKASEAKKKGKRQAIKEAITGKPSSSDAGTLDAETIRQLLDANPALKELVRQKGGDQAKIADILKKLSAAELLTGMPGMGGKNKTNLASHAFWKTQPVPGYNETTPTEEGPIKIIDPKAVPADPPVMYEGFEWVTMDLTNDDELSEVYDLLTGHYVEDDEAMFRFNYSRAFLNWALKAPGWRKEWHIGVRATKSRKLVAFISGIPIQLRIREKTVGCSEVNFLCIHKKLRAKRLAPVLIKEITRRCYQVGIFQAIYTAGVLLPTPVSTCRYYHRSLNWEKLYDVGFSPLPPGQTKARQVAKYRLPSQTATPGLRPIERRDMDMALDLLKRYLGRFSLAQDFSKEEATYWLLDEAEPPEKVVWAYVVEDPSTKKITDFFSFYSLESTVIGNKKHKTVNAAYLYYYGCEAAFQGDEAAYKKRLNTLFNDALVLAKAAKFDVMNALSLLDNPYFLEQQKFGAGDGQLHYYLYNYRAAQIAGGLDPRGAADERNMGGVGVVML